MSGSLFWFFFCEMNCTRLFFYGSPFLDLLFMFLFVLYLLFVKFEVLYKMFKSAYHNHFYKMYLYLLSTVGQCYS